MKIAMMTRNAALYSHQRLKEAAQARGHELDFVNTLRCSMNIASRRPEIYYDGQKLPRYGLPCCASSRCRASIR